LLDNSLPEAEQTSLNRHVDACEACQRTLESLVAGKESWDGVARRLANAGESATPALADVMALAKQSAETITSGGTSSAEADLPLNFLQPSDHADSLGRLGGYEILQVIGRGGFGVVLKALDTSLRRIVAIKVLSPSLAANASARRRFVREARAAAAVVHEHVVAIHAVADQHEPPFLVMQYIEGKTLQERLDKSGPLAVREVLRIGMQTAAGLAAAHAQGLVHRDIKPSNILLENGVERVKLTDFGLARAMDDASVTQSGVIAGTPQYMSPEQARGESIGHRSDLFSLGSVLYAMCVGHAPFRASTTMGVLKRVCEESPRPLREVIPELPEWLARIIDKLLAKRPEDRCQSAREVAELLGQSLAHLQQPLVVPLPAVSVTAAATAPAPRPVIERPDFYLKLVTLPPAGLFFILLVVFSFGMMRWQEMVIVTLVLGLWVFFIRWVIGQRHASAVEAAKAAAPIQPTAPPGDAQRVPDKHGIADGSGSTVSDRTDVELQRKPSTAAAERNSWLARVPRAAWVGLALFVSVYVVALFDLQGEIPSAAAKALGSSLLAVSVVYLAAWAAIAAVIRGLRGPLPGPKLEPRPWRIIMFFSLLTVFTIPWVSKWVRDPESHIRSVLLSDNFPARETLQPIVDTSLFAMSMLFLVVGIGLGVQHVVRGVRADAEGHRRMGAALTGFAFAALCGFLLVTYAQNFANRQRVKSVSPAHLTLFVAGPNVDVTLNNERVAVPSSGQVDLRLVAGEYVITTIENGQPRMSSGEMVHSGQVKVVDASQADAIRVSGPLVLAYGPGSSAPNVNDYVAIQGRWVVVSQIRNDVPVTESQRGQWIEFDRGYMRSDVPYTPRAQAFVSESLVALYAHESPSQIDILNVGAKGIYKLDGDRLTLAIADAGQPRPTEFVSRPASAITLTVCRRAEAVSPSNPAVSANATVEPASPTSTNQPPPGEEDKRHRVGRSVTEGDAARNRSGTAPRGVSHR
jgi:serine/threonine-protein kinase